MKKIILMFILLVFFMPIINAQEISDSINQQFISQYSQYANIKTADNIDPQEALKLAMAQNPELRQKVRNAIIIISILIVLLIIDIILKGFAMWRASKNNSKTWFWLLLIVNSLGILPIIYFIISRKQNLKKK